MQCLHSLNPLHWPPGGRVYIPAKESWCLTLLNIEILGFALRVVISIHVYAMWINTKSKCLLSSIHTEISYNTMDKGVNQLPLTDSVREKI